MNNTIVIEEKKYNKKIVKFLNIWLMFLLYSLGVGYLFSIQKDVDSFKPVVIGGIVGLSFPLYIPIFILNYLL
jgi:hypothetical protein